VTGRLNVNGSVSRLNGTPLAIQGDPDPFGAATNLILSQGMQSGDCIAVTGAVGNIGNVGVIFMTGAVAAPGACA
jgi:hypothetical protein